MYKIVLKNVLPGFKAEAHEFLSNTRSTLNAFGILGPISSDWPEKSHMCQDTKYQSKIAPDFELTLSLKSKSSPELSKSLASKSIFCKFEVV